MQRKKEESKPRTTVYHTASTYTRGPPPPTRRKPLNPLIILWILQREQKGCYRTFQADLIQTDIPGYQNLSGCQQHFRPIKEHIHHQIKKSVTNFRKPLEVTLKLAITLKHRATGETYTPLEYHWLVC